MVTRLIPPLGTPIALADIVAAFMTMSKKNTEYFRKYFSDFIGTEYSFLIDSGRNAFFIILESLKSLSEKKEVIIPAYTCPTVAYSVVRAGLKVKLCDVDIETLNFNIESLKKIVGKETLCIIPTHLFGMPCGNIYDVIKIAKENHIIVVEDVCQAVGANLDKRMTGSLGDIGFFSFGKGKNFTMIEGGAIVTNSSIYAEIIKKRISRLSQANLFSRCRIVLLLCLYAIFIKPFWFNIVAKLKKLENINYAHYSSPSLLSDFQAAVGLRLLNRLNKLNRARIENGKKLYRILKPMESCYILIQEESRGKAVYPFFPVIIKDKKKRQCIYENLFKSGVGSAKMYPVSLNKIEKIGDNHFCPSAEFIADRLLILPTNPFVKLENLKTIEKVFKNCGGFNV